MRGRAVSYAILLLFVSASLLFAQAPEMSEFEKCFGYPTLADEIRQMTGEPEKIDLSNQMLDTSDGITIGEIRFKGAIHATAQERKWIASELIKHPSDAKLQELAERARDAWQQLGYFKVRILEPEFGPATMKGNEAIINATIHVEEGARYTFNQLEWGNATVFSADELTPLFPLHHGDIFNTERVREGLKALRDAYGGKGYINFTAEPDPIIDDRTHEISLSIDLIEGKQFRVGSVQLVTTPTAKERPVADAIMAKARAMIGQPYDQTKLDHIFDGTGFRPGSNSELRQNNYEGTVEILLAFPSPFGLRACVPDR